MNHGVFIRLNYKEDYPHLNWRMSFFESMVLPRFLKQTAQNFDLWVYCNPLHADRLKAMNKKVKTYTTNRCDHSLPKYNIQTRHDSDDLVSLDYIAAIGGICSHHKKTTPLVISFQPYKLDIWTMAKYPYARYNAKNCSAFQSLYFPDTSKEYGYIYNHNHRRIWEKYPDVVTVPVGFCDITVHDCNDGTKL
jgi:hypothetical protein